MANEQVRKPLISQPGKEHEFKLGDVVKLRSGGPQSVVIGIERRGSRLEDQAQQVTIVQLLWIDDAGTPQDARVPPAAVVLDTAREAMSIIVYVDGSFNLASAKAAESQAEADNSVLLVLHQPVKSLNSQEIL